MNDVPRGKQPESGPFAAAVSEEIRAALARHRMTAKALAIEAKLSVSYVSKRLRDEAPFTLNDIELICAALGENLASLLQAAARSVYGDDDDGPPITRSLPRIQ